MEWNASMQVKSDNVFLLQASFDQSDVRQFVMISDGPADATTLFLNQYPETQILGITSLSQYVDVHKKIISSLNCDENAWPLIVDQGFCQDNGF